MITVLFVVGDKAHRTCSDQVRRQDPGGQGGRGTVERGSEEDVMNCLRL